MISEKPWRAEAVLILGAAMLMIAASTAIGASLLEERSAVPRFTALVVGTLIGQCFAMVLVHFFLRYHRVSWREFLGLYRRRVLLLMTAGMFTAVVVTPLGMAVTYVSSRVLTELQGEAKQQMVVEVLESAKETGQRIVFALTAIIMAPLIEETMFRGILYPVLKQQGYPRLALWGTSLLFAAIHTNLLTFFPLFLFAVVLVALYEWTDSLIVPISAHATFNAINFVLLVKQPEIEQWLKTFDPV